MTLPPHLEFFGSMVDAKTELDVLKEYILHMDNSIQEARMACQTSDQEAPLSLESIADDYSDLLAEPFPRLLHTGIIISIVIFLENELNFLANSLRKTEKLRISINDLKGSFIEKFKKYCLHVAKFPFPVSDQNWEDLHGVLEIRNCLVHNNGFLGGFGKASTVRAFTKRHGTPNIDNDWLAVNANTSLKVLEIVKIFVETFHEAALQKYPEEEEGSNNTSNPTN
jgi:hypothetical protein